MGDSFGNFTISKQQSGTGVDRLRERHGKTYEVDQNTD